jgi:hypothetical protein
VSFFNVELAIAGGRGGDFVIDTNGEPIFDVDTFEDDTALRGELLRMLQQNPRFQSNGIYVGEPDDPYHPDDGAGLSQLVDKLYTAEFRAAVTMQVLEGMAQMASVLDDPAPTIAFSIDERGKTSISIKYTRITGESRTLPAILLSASGG